jgi:hypothetical protein
MKNKVLMGLAAIAIVAVLSSCGKKPQAEIDATNAAITAAQTAEAAVYVPDEFAALQDSMKAIMANITAQESKLFKNFGATKTELASTLTLADKVAADAAARKEEVKTEADTLMTNVKAVIVENGVLMKRAPRGKEGAAVLNAMKTDMSAIEASVTEAQGLIENGTYMDALNKLKAAKDKADGINTELKDAIEKVTGKRPGAMK